MKEFSNDYFLWSWLVSVYHSIILTRLLKKGKWPSSRNRSRIRMWSENIFYWKIVSSGWAPHLKMFVPLLLYQRVVLNCYRVPHVVFLKINTDHVTTTSNNTHTLTLWKCSFSENIHLAPNTPPCCWLWHWISMFSFLTLDSRYVGHLYCDKKPCRYYYYVTTGIKVLDNHC